MLLKVIGIVLIIVTCSSIGYKIAHSLEGRLKDIRNFRLCIMTLEKEIGFLSNPLPAALLTASKNTGNTSNIFKECSNLLKSKQGLCVSDAWRMSVDKFFNSTYLNQNDKELLFSFGNCLGSYDVDNQIQNIKLIKSHLQEQEKYAEESVNKYSKMYRKLGFLGGLAICVVFI